MNGRVLFDFMYDQFVWPAHPFAARSFESSARGPKAALPSDVLAVAPVLTADEPSPRAVIVPFDQRKKTT